VYFQKALRISGLMRKPPTVIHKPLINADRERIATKIGQREESVTTSDSATRRSRKKTPK
jgi:hypothetical protein